MRCFASKNQIGYLYTIKSVPYSKGLTYISLKNWCRWPRASNFALSTKCIVWYPILFKYRNLQDYKIESGTKLNAGCKCTCTYYVSVQSIWKYLHEQTRSISSLYAILNTNLFTNIDLPSAFDFIFIFHYETKSFR